MAYRFKYYKYRVRYNRFSPGPVRVQWPDKRYRRKVKATVYTKRRTTVYRKRYGPKGRRYFR